MGKLWTKVAKRKYKVAQTEYLLLETSYRNENRKECFIQVLFHGSYWLRSQVSQHPKNWRQFFQVNQNRSETGSSK